MLESLFSVLVPSGLQLYQKETKAPVFFCEYCEIFKNSFSHRTPLVAASIYCFKNTKSFYNTFYRFSCSSKKFNGLTCHILARIFQITYKFLFSLNKSVSNRENESLVINHLRHLITMQFRVVY